MIFNSKKRDKDRKTSYYGEDIEEIGLDLTTKNIRELTKGNSDIFIREIYINGNKELQVSLVYIDGLINVKNVDDDVFKPLIQEISLSRCKKIEDVINLIEHGTVYHISQKNTEKIEDCINDIFNGFVAIIFDNSKKALTFNVKGFEKRNITEPSNENVYKGGKDSFIEDIRTNTGTIRRKIRTYKLTVKEIIVGKQSLTTITLVYIKGIANENILAELEKRLYKIKTDGVLSSGVIEENIIDNKYSFFPQAIYTERPDKFCANIIEGRIGILIDGLPISLIVPATFDAFLQAPEDYSQHYIFSSILRLLRFILTFVTVFLPSLYVSVTTFHQEMIPTKLALAITASKEGVPFPSFMEVIFMLIAFEILLEAGLRLPKTIGQAVSIVGAVVVGQAAVDAKLVSPAVVVVIALTAISSFTMPNQDFSNALRIWRFLFVFLSSSIGLFGLSLGGIILLTQLASMEVFGIPYLAPFVGEDNRGMKDSLFRFPFSSQYKRPISLKTINKKRQG